MIRRGKAYGAIGGFAVAVIASRAGGAVLFDILLRGVFSGLIGYVAGWAGAVFAARHILRAETQAVVDRVIERRRQALARARGESS